MSLARIINCLIPVNPEVGRIPEHDSSLSHGLKLAGGIGAIISTGIYFNSEDTKNAVIAVLISVGVYLAGAAKDYLTLRKVDQIQAEIEQREEDIKNLPPFKYNQKYPTPL